MLWQGKPIEEYSKAELVLIIEVLAKNLRDQSRQHMKDLENLLG